MGLLGSKTTARHAAIQQHLLYIPEALRARAPWRATFKRPIEARPRVTIFREDIFVQMRAARRRNGPETLSFHLPAPALDARDEPTRALGKRACPITIPWPGQMFR